MKEGRCSSLSNFYKNSISDDLFNIVSTEIKNSGNLCEILDKCFEYRKKNKEIFEDE